MVGEATNDTAAIELRALTKAFGSITALDGVDLRVEQGCFFGLLGPNGAGKSTAIGIMATLLRPTSGQALLLGRDTQREAAEVRRSVGLVFQESSLDPELTPRETLEFTARLYHLDAAKRRAREMIDVVDLGDRADWPARTLSGGQRRRLEIARGLLHRPKVLFLDEPTVGLDPAARAAIWQQLREIQREGRTTICLTTHSMEEADALCERLAILDHGRIVVDAAPDALKRQLGGDQVHLLLESDADVSDALLAVEGVRGAVRDATGRWRVTLVEGSRRLPALIDAVRAHGISEVDLRRPSLEAVFLHHTGHAFEDEVSAA
jgi:ABC-2 type transport system ATP-binding protein